VNLEVTPVGRPDGEPESGAVIAGGADPFGARPARRRRRALRILLGIPLELAALVAIGAGIADVVRSGGSLREDAVARGTVTARAAAPAGFTVPAGERQSYTVYLDVDGVGTRSDVLDLAVRDTTCTATMPDGVRTVFRGARQGSSMTIGDLASVGHFSSQPGAVRVACAYTEGTPQSRRVRPDPVPFLVTPGTPGELTGGVLKIIGGAFGLLLAGWLVVTGLRGRRTRA
jgi:hypothetical protein